MATASSESACEEWRAIPGFLNYEASSLGRIRRAKRGKGTRAGKIRLPYALPSGYLVIDMWHEGQKSRLYVHRAIALAFHGEPPFAAAEAAHGNGAKADNRSGNIAWKTKAENEADKDRHGTRLLGSAHVNSKLSEDDVRSMRERRAAGETLAALAAAFGVGFQNVGLICQRKTWAHI